MTRIEIIEKLKDHFDIRELVCPHTYKAFGDKSWQFLDTEELHLLLVIRVDILKVAMTINNYHIGGTFTQRGIRCNICQLVKTKTSKNQIYMSAHCNGAGFDADADGMTAQQARVKIKENQNLLPYPIRLEATTSGEVTTWIHFDKYDDGTGRKVVEFAG
jgi:hypothetical protein